MRCCAFWGFIDFERKENISARRPARVYTGSKHANEIVWLKVHFLFFSPHFFSPQTADIAQTPPSPLHAFLWRTTTTTAAAERFLFSSSSRVSYLSCPSVREPSVLRRHRAALAVSSLKKSQALPAALAWCAPRQRPSSLLLLPTFHLFEQIKRSTNAPVDKSAGCWRSKGPRRSTLIKSNKSSSCTPW